MEGTGSLNKEHTPTADRKCNVGDELLIFSEKRNKVLDRL